MTSRLPWEGGVYEKPSVVSSIGSASDDNAILNERREDLCHNVERHHPSLAVTLGAIDGSLLLFRKSQCRGAALAIA